MENDNRKAVIRTKPNRYYCPRGTKILKVIDIVYADKSDKPALLKVVTDEEEYAWVRPDDLEPSDEVEKEIERLRNDQKNTR